MWGVSRSSENQYYSLVTLNDNLFATGFAGMRASLLVRKSPAGREIKVVVASPSKVSEGAVIKFAKKLTKHIRVSRGWSAVSATIQPMEIRELPPTRDTPANQGQSYCLDCRIA
jgi:hypothetical protein